MIVWWNSDLIPSTPDSGVCQIQIKMWCLASSFIISRVSLGKKIKIFGIILPTLNNEWAEILLSGLISWLASYSSDFFSPQESKKHYYNKIIIKIKSLEISRSPWFEGWVFSSHSFTDLSRTLSPHDCAFLSEAAYSACPAAAVEHLGRKILCPQDSPQHSVVTDLNGAQGVWFGSLHFLLWNFYLLWLMFVFIWLLSYWKFFSSYSNLLWIPCIQTHTHINIGNIRHIISNY